MLHDGLQVCHRLPAVFDNLNESVQPSKAVQFFAAIDFRRVQRSPQYSDRFVIGLERNRKRMPVLAAQSK
jgi:hypothetical protein